MELKLVRHLWGVDLDAGWQQLLNHWQSIGYSAVEVSLRVLPDPQDFLNFLESSQLDWIPQVFTRDFIPGGSVNEHLSSMLEQIEETLDLNPLFINVHSGSDMWTPQQAEEFFAATIALEEELGILIAHETHRQRYLGTPWRTAEILKTFPDLRLTADFSHWVCVCERLLPDMPDIIALAARHTHHLHARVGFEEGPQVPDPRAPEFAQHLQVHESWWQQVWQSQRQRNLPISTLTPEFGPPPYLHTLPFSQEPVADLNAICDWMAQRQAGLFKTATGSNETATGSNAKF